MKIFAKSWAVILVAGAATIACGSSDDSAVGTNQGELKGGGTCVYDGVQHSGNQSFPSTDGCNTCSCLYGSVICTKRACVFPPPPPPPAVCTYDGVDHSPGEGFPSSDGCNVCSCQANGRVICTKRACLFDAGQPNDAGPPDDDAGQNDDAGTLDAAKPADCTYNGVDYSNGDGFPSSDGCNMCSCVSGHVLCTKRACPAN